jgi:hypothetical protein
MIAPFCTSDEQTIKLPSGRDPWKEKWKFYLHMARVGLYMGVIYPFYGCPNHVHPAKCWTL